MNVYAQDKLGIEMQKDCLLNNTCELYTNKLLKIKEGSSEEGNTATALVQDAFLGATFFIGTVCTIALVWSGFLMMTAGSDEGNFDKGKKGIINSIIGLGLVVLSYLIIRIIQYIAQGQQ